MDSDPIVHAAKVTAATAIALAKCCDDCCECALPADLTNLRALAIAYLEGQLTNQPA